MSKIIALDADGVLVDYNEAYARCWYRAFGEKLTIKNRDAYYAYNQYDCKFTSDEQKAQFDLFKDTDEFWSDMGLFPEVFTACHILVNEGYELVCVTKMDNEFKAARVHNFVSYGLPISETYCVNDKRETLYKLQPLALVDDKDENFEGHEESMMHCALVDRNQYDSPNFAHEDWRADSYHDSLRSFVDYWLERR